MHDPRFNLQGFAAVLVLRGATGPDHTQPSSILASLCYCARVKEPESPPRLQTATPTLADSKDRQMKGRAGPHKRSLGLPYRHWLHHACIAAGAVLPARGQCSECRRAGLCSTRTLSCCLLCLHELHPRGEDPLAPQPACKSGHEGGTQSQALRTSVQLRVCPRVSASSLMPTWLN